MKPAEAIARREARLANLRNAMFEGVQEVRRGEMETNAEQKRDSKFDFARPCVRM